MKKLLAILLAVVLAFSMTAVAFAEGEESTSAAAEEETIPKPSDIITNAATRNALLEIQKNNTVVEEAGTENEYSYIDIDDAKFILILVQYSDYRDALLKWNEVFGITTPWADAWLNYYGNKIGYAISGIADDPTAIFSALGEMAGDLVEGNIDSETASPVFGEVGASVAESIGGMTGNEVDAETRKKISDAVGGLVGAVGEVIPGESEPVEQKTSEEYAQEIIDMVNNGTPVNEITTKIFEDLRAGVITADQVPQIAEIISNSDQIDPAQNETVQEILGFLEGIGTSIGGEGEGITFPDFSDVTLPVDIGSSESGSFLDTILGIIGSIGDIFNPDAGTDDPATDDPSGDDFVGGDTTIPDTGDVSFVAVAAVAVVAGAALVLTRKKHNDAE